MVSYVYPGATHNRFQHSLGTMHVMDLLLNTLLNNPIYQDLPDAAKERVINREVQRIRDSIRPAFFDAKLKHDYLKLKTREQKIKYIEKLVEKKIIR